MGKLKNKNDDNEIKYLMGSNIIEHNGKTLYLIKVLWEEGLTYEDVKAFIVN